MIKTRNDGEVTSMSPDAFKVGGLNLKFGTVKYYEPMFSKPIELMVIWDAHTLVARAVAYDHHYAPLTDFDIMWGGLDNGQVS